MSKFDFICVSGYGKSGSGACINLLNEFDYIGGIDNEFRIAKDPYGISDLESSLVTDWEFVRHNTAINDFLLYCEMLSRNNPIYGKIGKGFSEKLNVDLKAESLMYIDNLTNFKYSGDTLLHRYKESALQYLLNRIRSKLGFSNHELMYFTTPSSDLFLFETQKYIKNLFKSYASGNNFKKIVLDQAIPPNNIDKTIKYFDSNKIIIIDRDPRDIYATMLMEKRLLGAGDNDDILVEKYIYWHKSIRKKANFKEIKSNVLELKFEDFFVKYDNTVNSVKEFLEINYKHANKKTKFNPDKLLNYVGIWRQLENQKPINRIYKEFPDECFPD